MSRRSSTAGTTPSTPTGARGDGVAPAPERAPDSGAPAARWAGDAGMATAEYAVATLAAVGFAGLLYAVLRSGEVQEMLTALIRSALGTP
ncbi:DUF4244 domain-containing protein [Aquipuribacter sp. SD81]|uniref:DUF4244 domain-containing protein n=1 Tax=Aquipuribacter sp. SD81 TaxID=3127703 RepID=UPI0030174330